MQTPHAGNVLHAFSCGVCKSLMFLYKYHQVRKLCGVYAENAYERMNVYLRAFRAEDDHAKMELISQAKPLSETGAKLLQSIRILQVINNCHIPTWAFKVVIHE